MVGLTQSVAQVGISEACHHTVPARQIGAVPPTFGTSLDDHPAVAGGAIEKAGIGGKVSVRGNLCAEVPRQSPAAASRPDHCLCDDVCINQFESPAAVFARCRSYCCSEPHFDARHFSGAQHQPVEPCPVEMPACAVGGEDTVLFTGRFVRPGRNQRAIFNEGGVRKKRPGPKLTQQALRYRRQHFPRLWSVVPSRLDQNHPPPGRVAAQHQCRRCTGRSTADDNEVSLL